MRVLEPVRLTATLLLVGLLVGCRSPHAAGLATQNRGRPGDAQGPQSTERFVRLPEHAHRYFFVGGEVQIPGQKPYLQPMTVTLAIEAAGGFTKDAKRTKVQVVRMNGDKLVINVAAIEKRKAEDVDLYVGDAVYVGSR